MKGQSAAAIHPADRSAWRPSESSSPSSYRADIDGLRAVAVVAVVIYHAFPALLPGGFIGVDVFFVISGFLITGIITREIDDPGGFSFASFYARRIRRIFPALIVVLAASLATGLYFYLPSELSSLARNAAANAALGANLIQLSESGYFDASAQAKPLLHLWSLGIEEQFYLIWPLGLWLTPRRWRPALVGVVIAVSLALNLALIRTHPQAIFYLPVARAWELVAGAALVGVTIEKARTREAFSALSIVCGLAFFLYNDHTPFPGWAALAPVIGSAAAILGRGSLFNRIVLSQPPVLFVGRISYSLYLWHWPLLVFTRAYLFRPLTSVETILLVGGAFALAWITYELVERPIRAGKAGGTTTAIAGMSAVAVCAAIAMKLPPQLPDEISRMTSVSTGSPEWRIHGCTLVDGDRDFAPDCVDERRPLVAIWGDSTAAALMPGLRRIQSDRFGLAEFSVSSCPPLLVPGFATTKDCIARNHEILASLVKARPAVVLLHALWVANTEQLKPTVDALRDNGVSRIIIVGRVPMWVGGLPDAVSAYWRRTGQLIPERTRLFVEEMPPGGDPMQVVAEDLHVEYFSVREALCNSDGCLTRVGKDLVTSDWLHMAPAGATVVAQALAPKLLPLLTSDADDSRAAKKTSTN